MNWIFILQKNMPAESAGKTVVLEAGTLFRQAESIGDDWNINASTDGGKTWKKYLIHEWPGAMPAKDKPMLDTPITTSETQETAAGYQDPAEQQTGIPETFRTFFTEGTDPFLFSPHMKIFISGSPLPKPGSNDDKGIWSRAVPGRPAPTIDTEGMRCALGPTVNPPDSKRETFLALSTPQTITEAAEAIRGLSPTSRDLW